MNSVNLLLSLQINNKTVVKIVNRPWDIINWTSWITKFLNL